MITLIGKNLLLYWSCLALMTVFGSKLNNLTAGIHTTFFIILITIISYHEGEKSLVQFLMESAIKEYEKWKKR